jgi:asparagine synthase (glutamine-hydrolysing)
VEHHLIADVPVGVFLSAGIDSAVIAGLAVERRNGDVRAPIAAVTLGFEEFRGTPDDEVPQAIELAQHFGTAHSVRVVGREEFVADLPSFFAAMDQPTIDGANTWFVSKAMRERGLKVALSGLGGDELFGGYPSFRDIPRWVGALRLPSQIPGLGVGFRRTCVALSGLFRNLPSKLPGMIQYGGSYPGAYFLRRGLFMPWELPELIGEETAREGLRRLDPLQLIADVLSPDPAQSFAKVAALETSLYMGNQLLRDADWTSMAHSVEVRVPLVDIKLATQIAPVLVDRSRAAGKELLSKSTRPPLPAKTRARAKTGFLTPVSAWSQERLPGPQFPQPSNALSYRAHWSRRWAMTVLAEFSLVRPPRRAAIKPRTVELERAS